MDGIAITQINVERLSRWSGHLIDEHATPFLLIGFGHDQRSGDVVLCACEETDDTTIRQVLRGILRRLESDNHGLVARPPDLWERGETTPVVEPPAPGGGQ